MAFRIEETLNTDSSNGTSSARAQPIDLGRYIPLGTLYGSIENGQLSPHWEEVNSEFFRSLNLNRNPALGKHLIQLTSKNWIRVFARLNYTVKQDPIVTQNSTITRDPTVRQDSQCILRVYLLPDDVGRAQIPRSATKVRASLRFLLATINCAPTAWARSWAEAEAAAKWDQSFEGYQPEATEDDSLFYIFNTLTSPTTAPKDVDDYYAANAIQALLESGKSELGLQTELYQYQRRSCAKMIQRETRPNLRLDPRLESMIGPTGITFYLDRFNTEVLSHPRSYHEARGGILAETMGYGKTLICLATIIATKGRLPETPPEFSTSLRSSLHASNLRSLTDMCALNIARNNIQWKLYFQERAKEGEYYDRCIRILERAIGRYKVPVVQGRSRRALTSTQTMYLSSTTLIVVPPNLLKQWQREIHQHVQPGLLSVLHIDNSSIPVPNAEELRLFDVILMSNQRFEEEIFPLGGNRANSDVISCSCSDPAKRRFCHEHPYRSAMRDVHFLRIIVDEGQRFVSGSITQAILALKNLNVDARWIVSGTPAAGLVGAEVDLAARESFPDVEMSSKRILPGPSSTGIDDRGINDLHEAGSRISSPAVSGPSNGDKITAKEPSKIRKSLSDRQKAKDLDEERKSIERLGNIVKSFLRARPWANDELEDGANWNTYIVPNKNGTRKPLSLRAVLNGLVVRHQYEDVEQDLKLPPLENKLVLLQPCFYDKLSINLFILSLTANAVTSERADQDYMFHSRNRKSLEILIRNLRHSGFAWSGFLPSEIEKTCTVSRKYLETDGKAVSDGDRALLEHAISMGDLALSTPAWKAFSHLSEVGMFVKGFPSALKPSLGLCPEVEPRSDPLLIGATQLCLVQEAVETDLYSHNFQKALQGIGQSKQNGMTNGEKGSNLSSLLQDSPKKNSGTSKGIPQSGISEVKKISASQFSNVTVRTQQQPLTVSEEEFIIAPKTSASKDDLKSILRTTKRKPDIPNAYNLLSQMTLMGTSSAKLSYLIDKVHSLYQSEKILVFYEGDDIAYYCAQAFELLGIPHLIYARGISQKLRNEYQTRFNTGSIYRVLLMDLKQAALGLHMASASRVFFINPVWQPAIEAQAIKRAHRIGQTKPVFVETLVLEGTIEEKMLQRRKNMSTEEHQKAARSLLDDTPMKDIILNAPLLAISHQEISDHSLQFAPLRDAQQLFARSIVLAYGSHQAVLDTIRATDSREPVPHNVEGEPIDAPPAIPTTIDPTNKEQSKPATKKRKLVFVDELERRKIAILNKQVEAQTDTSVPNAEGVPWTKRRRCCKITFADEKNLALSTVFLIPDDSGYSTLEESTPDDNRA